MKLLMCQICGDIIAPNRENMSPRWCVCGRHAVWWVDGASGILRIHDREWPMKYGPPDPLEYRAFVIGLNNLFLTWDGKITAEIVKAIHDRCPDTYLFKRIGSPLIRIRPGESNDTGYENLPNLAPPEPT